MAEAANHPLDSHGVPVLRSQLGRVRGLGSAKSGTGHWWAERITSVALVPLTLWFVFVALHLVGSSRMDVAHWAAHPVNATLMLALIFATFHHTQLGLQVVIEDYIHSDTTRMASLLAMKAGCFLLGTVAAVSVLKLAITG